MLLPKTKMATENSRRIPLEKAASIDDINDAINALSALEIKRLEKYARWRVKGLGVRKTGRDWEVLFHETVVAFCSGTRRWNKNKVDFLKALIEAMRSISDNWRRTYDENEPKLESELITTSFSGGEESNPLALVSIPDWNTQRELEAKRDVEIIENLLMKRETAALVLMGWKDKMTGPEIQAELALSQTEYDKEVKWIRRTVKAEFKEKHDA